MYLIQQTTKQSSDDILGFFFDFGKEATIQISESVAKKKGNQRSFKRYLENYYPGTVIPFMIEVEGYLHKDTATNIKNLTSAYVTVSFPNNTTYIDTQKMMDQIIEKQLLGGSSIPDFEPPKTFASGGLKGLVEQVLGNRQNGQTLLDSGHTRQVGPTTETVDGPGDQSQLGSDNGQSYLHR